MRPRQCGPAACRRPRCDPWPPSFGPAARSVLLDHRAAPRCPRYNLNPMLHERRAGRIRPGFAFTVRERFRYRERRRRRSLSAFGRAAPLQAWRRCPSESRTTTGPLAHDAAVRAPRGRSVDDRCLHGGRKWGRNPALKAGHLRRRVSKASRGVPHNVGTVGTDAARNAFGGSSDAAAYEQRCKDAFHDAPRSAPPPSLHCI